jgi:hypothetical protein
MAAKGEIVARRRQFPTLAEIETYLQRQGCEQNAIDEMLAFFVEWRRLQAELHGRWPPKIQWLS